MLVISIAGYVVYQRLPINYEIGEVVGEYVGDKKGGIPHGHRPPPSLEEKGGVFYDLLFEGRI